MLNYNALCDAYTVPQKSVLTSSHSRIGAITNLINNNRFLIFFLKGLNYNFADIKRLFLNIILKFWNVSNLC